MSKVMDKQPDDDMRAEYDLRGGVRGKYYDCYKQGTNVVKPFLGYWKITSMECWRADYIDLIVPGFIEFEDEDGHLMGSFQFGAVVGWLDCRAGVRAGKQFVEWSWDGRNDSDAASGRGWAAIEDGKLVGRLFIHCTDDSAF